MSKDTITATNTLDFERAVTVLESILVRMKQGRLVLGEGDNAVVITPANKVEIGMEARNAGGVQGFSFDLRWAENGTEANSLQKPVFSEKVKSVPCSLAAEEACACSEEDFELAFLKECGFFQPTSCNG